MKKGTGKILIGSLLIFPSVMDFNQLWFLCFLGIGLVFWGMLQRGPQVAPRNTKNRKSQNEEIGFEIETTFTTSSESNEIDTGLVKSSRDGGWVINPKSTFPLTIYEVNHSTAKELKQILEEGWSLGYYEASQNIMPIVTRYNLECKEINDYVAKFKPIFQGKIEEQINKSLEWPEASDLDKEDLLAEFKDEAVSSLDIQPYCDLEVLFEGGELDVTIDDTLIEKYGFESIHFYLSRKQKVHNVPSDHNDRKKFEKLVKVGLALRGREIPINLMLESLKLKEMSKLVSDLNPPKFYRKAKAIEFLENVVDINDRLGKGVSFRSLFQVLPLPEEYKNIDLTLVSKAQRYAREVSSLLAGTYYKAGHATRDLEQRMKLSLNYIRGWRIVDFGCCDYCKRLSEKRFPENKYPQVPLHIGCRCHVSPIYGDDE